MSVKLAVITVIIFALIENMDLNALAMKVLSPPVPRQIVANVKMSMNVTLEKLFVLNMNFARI